MLVVGFGGITMAATANTMIQLNVPDALRGRAMSVYTTVFAGSTPIGGLLFGWLASAAGVAVAVAIGGIGAVVGLAALLWVRGQVGFVTVPEPIARRVVPRAAEASPARSRRPRSRVASSRRWSVRGPPALSRAGLSRPAPSTTAAFKPPNLNDVDNTRR